MNISCFGGCWCDEKYGEEVYNFIKTVFRNKDVKLITGGTIGVMEAIGRGARENNIEVIGVSLRQWENYLNKYNTEVVLFDDEDEQGRVRYMLDNADAFIVFDGDLGTYEEMFSAWFHARFANKKIYILGKEMRDSITYLLDKNYIFKDCRDNLILCDYNNFKIEE